MQFWVCGTDLEAWISTSSLNFDRGVFLVGLVYNDDQKSGNCKALKFFLSFVVLGGIMNLFACGCLWMGALVVSSPSRCGRRRLGGLLTSLDYEGWLLFPFFLFLVFWGGREG